jgi:cytochrome oxidase Cu insertion factor (SCO1/SenC/PrrC family)
MSSSLRAGRFARALATLALSAVLAARTEQIPPDQRLPDVQKLGPQVGQSVPDFTLTDQHGQPRTLASLVGRAGLMLVFFRSADW